MANADHADTNYDSWSDWNEQYELFIVLYRSLILSVQFDVFFVVVAVLICLCDDLFFAEVTLKWIFIFYITWCTTLYRCKRTDPPATNEIQSIQLFCCHSIKVVPGWAARYAFDCIGLKSKLVRRASFALAIDLVFRIAANWFTLQDPGI